MTTGRQPPGIDRLVSELHTFRYSVFRLETLQVYSDPGEAAGLAAFHRGNPEPPTRAAEAPWSALLRAHADAGRLQQRVHVAVESISDYLAYELCWEYGRNAAAGEDIRIIPVAIPVTEHWPVDVPQADFTLFDSRLLFHLHYDPSGVQLEAELVTDPANVAAACFIRDAALHHGVPWSAYMARHPELVRRLPSGVRP